MRASDVTWSCSKHQRPTNAGCAECGRVVNALRDALPAMRALKMRKLAAELMLGFAASQYGLAVAGEYCPADCDGATCETPGEQDARRQLHVAAHMFVTGRRRR